MAIAPRINLIHIRGRSNQHAREAGLIERGEIIDLLGDSSKNSREGAKVRALHSDLVVLGRHDLHNLIADQGLEKHGALPGVRAVRSQQKPRARRRGAKGVRGAYGGQFPTGLDLLVQSS